MTNPLLETFNKPYNTAPFSLIKVEHFKPAFIEGISLAKKEIDEIVQNPETPSFKNTIEAMEYSGQTLDRVSSIFFNLNSAEPSALLDLLNPRSNLVPKLVSNIY